MARKHNNSDYFEEFGKHVENPPLSKDIINNIIKARNRPLIDLIFPDIHRAGANYVINSHDQGLIRYINSLPPRLQNIEDDED
jgi:hypothetical protein